MRLHEENKQLRRKLTSYIKQAQDNELKLHRFQDMELRLISAATLADLLLLLFEELPDSFSLDVIAMMIEDRDYELRHSLNMLDLPSTYPQLIFINDAESLNSIYGDAPRAKLVRYDPAIHSGLFQAHTYPLKSLALLPLTRHGDLTGSLHLGSTNEERFILGTATDFLERLATIASICLENALNIERLKHAGLTDVLTGVHNRRYFDERLHEEADRAWRNRQTLGCLFLDVDHFKRVNDEHGHQSGDAVLKNVASLIRHELRSSDVLGRYGGEEFAALLPQTNLNTACEIAERIRARIESHVFQLPGSSLKATISIGIATLQNNGNKAETTETLAMNLLEEADRALYSAKHEGRNQTRYFNNGEVRSLTDPAVHRALAENA
ncbi:MAG: hypothetical protein BMS9Abin15_0710 [Gammaproteobacteria bacterium]|nr:MAG: hypothetical protein BMS9Abin15_0710 [Gammaproteobacteria bacterium]